MKNNINYERIKLKLNFENKTSRKETYAYNLKI